jgi:undecaprenyl diphosphate synthase
MTKDGSAPSIDPERLPAHIAIIMDGNGRWAKNRLMPRVAGHQAGAKAVDRVVTYCRQACIKALTLYSFSSENWNRPKGEVDALMSLLKRYVDKELARMIEKGIKFNVIGDLDALPPQAQKAVLKAMEKTSAMTGMTLTLALSYGSRNEIARAVKKIAQEAKDGLISTDDINEEAICARLDTHGLPDPDLLIRSGGDIRLSNFLLWQSAYTELYFTEKLWPDFTGKDIRDAVISFQNRERRFGMTGEQATRKSGRK